MLTQHTATAEELFTSKFQELTGESEWTIIGFAATLNDPWEYIDSVVDELQDELEEIHQPSWKDFINRVNIFKEEVDASLQVKHYQSEQTDKWYTEPEKPLKYDRNDYRTVPTYFTTMDERQRTSREEWRRVTEDNYRLRMLVEYGNFDIAVTEKTARAWLRVRTAVRKGVPYLAVGAIQIDMTNGLAQCGVVGCNHKGWLTVKDDGSSVEKKQWLEFQVLRLIMHLGDHDLGSKTKQFPVFMHVVSPVRDSAAQKLATHIMYCNNPKCDHTNLGE